MKQALNNQRGSVLMMSLLVLVVLGGMLAAASPMIVNEVKMNTVNRDMIDAQFAAEAGAKVGIAAVYAKNTDWSWLGKPYNLTTSATDTQKNYEVSIVNASTNVPIISSGLTSGTTYKITSTGTVNGVSRKAVVSVLYSSASGGIFSYAAFSNGAFSSNGQISIEGANIASNASTALNWSQGTVPAAYAVNGQVTAGVKGVGVVTCTSGSYAGKACGVLSNSGTISNQGTIDIAALTPAMPSFSMVGTDLTTTWTSGQWGGNTYSLTNSAYYYNGNYNLNGHNYSVPAGTTTTLYVNGTLNVMSGFRITGGGNLTIYAKGAVQLSGGNIDVGSTGSVSIYTPESMTINNNSYINGSTVTVLAQKSVTLNGGDINQSLSEAKTQIYTTDFSLESSSSSISGAGAGVVIATNNINITSGNAATTLFISNQSISAKASTSTVVGGLYSNGTISTTGIKVQYDSSTSTALGLSAGGSTDVSNLVWARE